MSEKIMQYVLESAPNANPLIFLYTGEMEDIRTIHIGADHAGFELKRELVRFLEQKHYEVIDHGAHEFDADDDYPDFILPVALAVAEDEAQGEVQSRGIIIGGSGQGEAIVANRVPGIRAMVFYGEPMSEKSAGEHIGAHVGADATASAPAESILELSRFHNDANVLSLGARFLVEEEACEAIERWLETAFSGDERHVRRLEKINEIDKFGKV